MDADSRASAEKAGGQPLPDGRGSSRQRQPLPDGRGSSQPRDPTIEVTDVYLLEGALSEAQVERIAHELLTDPVCEQVLIGADRARADALIEVHPLPGVMDPDAEPVALAIKAMLGVDVEVRTGRRYDMHGIDSAAARSIAERYLANTVIHGIYDSAYHPSAFPKGSPQDVEVRTVQLRDLDDAALQKLSREAHLFLSLDEMKAIQTEYRTLQRDPHEIELETLAQTWSEHCVHKTLKATIRYEGEIPNAAARPGHVVNDDGSITINNLLKSTVVAATHELMRDGIDWCLSVFVDNAGIIAFDEDNAVCFKCETHNHPSAIEPYGGAATGIGGCIRDIIGTGRAAKPIAATDVFCVAYPDHWSREADDADRQQLPAGCLHPKRILTQVVAGVRDYGNRMGIPTVNGTVWFDDDYVGNPLVYCGCIGILPRTLITGEPKAGDRIIAVGGRTGRDGIHGATFSSAELTDTHADEFSHAVQIGNPVTQKKMLDAILEARDHHTGCLFNAITDCGAGGFSSAVGEMGEKLGAHVQLANAPLKYEGLTPTEIWISEAQERMVLAVSPDKVATLRNICDVHNVELCDLGEFGTENAELILRYGEQEVGRLPMSFLHDGLPQVMRHATWSPSTDDASHASSSSRSNISPSIDEALLELLAHPNIASKRWIIQQYDHEVQGGSVVRPQVGVMQLGPSDAAVIMPVEQSMRGLGIANGLATGWRSDPYHMTLAAIDECVRNLTCVGVDPARIAILDNFCWPSCKDPRNLGSLVRAAEGCYDGAKAYRTPFISGKDSLNNQFTTEDGRTMQIPPTLLISGMGIVPDVNRCVTMDAKRAGNLLLVIGETTAALQGSHFAMLYGTAAGAHTLPQVDLQQGPKRAAAVYTLIQRGLVRSAHDCSEGGLLVAAAEMAFAGDLGLALDFKRLPTDGELETLVECFVETPSRYLIEVRRSDLDAVDAVLRSQPYAIIGEFDESKSLHLPDAGLNIEIEALRSAWLSTLDW